MHPSRVSWWRGLPAKVVVQSLLLSVPLLALGTLNAYQSRDVFNKIDDILYASAAVSTTAREALAKLAEAGYHARNNDREMFEDASYSSNLLMKALAWGTDSPVFRRDNDGELQKKWQALGWQESIGSVRTTEKIRQLAGEISFYYQGFSKHMLNVLSGTGSEESLKKSNKYEHLVVQNLRLLLDEVTRDALDRRSAIVALREEQMQRTFFLALLFFVIVAVSAWVFSYRDIVTPIVHLTEEVKKAGQGELGVRISTKSKDEIAALALAFNRMLVDLEKTTVSRDALVRETDERKRAEAKLRQSEKMGAVGQLAGGIAHDLNNGLTPVMGYLDMLILEESLAADTKELIREAKQSTQRCVDVVQKLMNFSRGTTQVRVRLEVGKLLSDLKKLLRPVFPATIQVMVEFPEDIGTLYANETDLMTALMNLAINARDAMAKSGGKFIVRASNVGDKVFFYVADTGMGMTPEITSRVFEPFFTTKAKGQGTGLGLAMVYNVIKDHGGTIEVTSQPGKGTLFYIYLPRNQREESHSGLSGPKQDATASLPDAPHKGHGSILFVDDEAPLRKMGKAFLERLGYTPFMAEDGEEAIRIYQNECANIAVIVLDMTMPKLSGLETIKRLLQINPAAKIVVASGFTAEGTTQDLLDAGASTFIQKPYTIGSLAAALQRLANSPL